jgi:hypothetical protein
MDIKVLIIAGDWPDKGEPVGALRTGQGADHRDWTSAEKGDKFVRVRINGVPDDFDICESFKTGDFDAVPAKRGMELIPKAMRRWRLPTALVDEILTDGRQRLLTLDAFEDRKP